MTAAMSTPGGRPPTTQTALRSGWDRQTGGRRSRAEATTDAGIGTPSHRESGAAPTATGPVRRLAVRSPAERADPGTGAGRPRRGGGPRSPSARHPSDDPRPVSLVGRAS